MKIYIIGDSISIQYGPYLEKFLAGVMAYSRKGGEEEALLNLDVPQGANGGDSKSVLAFLRALARNGGIDADLLLLNCGLHDIKRAPDAGPCQVSMDEYERNLRDIISVASAMGKPWVWIRTTPCDEHVHNRPGMTFFRFAADGEAYNTVADGIMREANVPILDLYTFTCNLGPDLYCDHVHFQDHIRQKQAAFIAGWLGARQR